MAESDRDMRLLQGILREGSQVITLLASRRDSISIFSSVTDTFGKIRFQLMDTWKENDPYNKTQLFESLFADLEKQYSNFKGRQLTVNVNTLSRTLTTKEDIQGELTLDSGYEVTLLEALSVALNFTMKITKPVDGKWGGQISNGSVDGMIGEVFRRDAHIAICSMGITGESCNLNVMGSQCLWPVC
ncbi:glutamate receptor ionotropic, delta-1-like [Palaemon carinicauda]|uniref:glutamate receptor ionotropic, delta-1-like n=1 Tax=Palaemon carinicauda TaxID=392227 RepID=UPI0035B5F9C8